MRLLKQVLDFYLNSSIHVAFTVVAITYVTFLEFGLILNKDLLFFIFFASITGYNFVKYYGLANWHHRHLTRWLKQIQLFSLLCFLAMCYFTLKLPLKILLIISIFGILTFFYAIPFLPKKVYLDEHRNLRDISGLKVYVIALVWAGVTVLLPVIINNHILNTDVWITAFQRFLFVIALMLPFEIRDLQYDDLKLSTIPQKIGIKQTKIIGIVILMVFFFIEFFKDEIQLSQIIALMLISFITMLFIGFCRKNQGKYYSAFWVEGLPIAWMLLTLLLY
ncbi:hypothetical protein AAFP94_14560 [Flavobacteriaceae bacterium MJ-SS4]|uniref:hypothetical protein n=1 Tax=Gilvirhabdus luticola TaxID=3079858 RepID=UPI0032DC08A1